MPINKDKYSKMLDELSKEYPELADDAAALQAGLESGDEEAPAEDEDMFGEEESDEAEFPAPKKSKKLPPELDDEAEEEDDAPLF